MTQKLSEYFNLVEKSRSFVEAPGLSAQKSQLIDVNKQIKKLGNQFADPAADISALLNKLTQLRKQQVELQEALKSAGTSHRSVIKRQVVETREKILEAAHSPNWESTVQYFKSNPVALTALIKQTGYDAMDPVKSLRNLPFRGRVTGPQATTYDYAVFTEDGERHSYSSVRKIILSLDQYQREFKSLALTFDALNRHVRRGVSIDGKKVNKIERVDRNKA